MSLLTPDFAAALADGVYGVNANPLLNVQERSLLLRCEPLFSIGRPDGESSHPFARSTSGVAPGGFSLLNNVPGGRRVTGLFAPVESDFGYVATGNGDWRGHMVVVTRGTMGPKGVSADWLSNFNVGLQPGPGGFPVHAGFNRIWSGFNGFVNRAIEHYRPEHIHCVGHSLGGALANLNALMLARAGERVSLYTFGAPRVGTAAFVADLSRRLSDRVKRVYHPADPVPMIPLLPFLHAPMTGGIRLAGPAGALVDASAHDMNASYARLVANQSWLSLERANTMLGDFQIDSWLQQSAQRRGGFVMRSAALLERIAKGLARLVAKASVYVIGSGLSAAATATLTTLDFVSWLLARASAMQAAIREEIMGLVNAIFGFMGRVANSMVSLTQSALRWVLDLLFDFLSNMARLAIDRLR
ncbi:lipase [Polymorphobacter multimanifer]|uniref:Pimeloyl-ACP methyl ester carboxylesterase n=1 Tax=Polymorphobacter multimanifer TaxID=1070431 RepID=A0A841LE99_9SPHN|nr:lipase family protein [Polymorphobacter multimanifer]MBB6227482.1 pimeloyl-ACP methyl ester carboxylesterase [Polymorphobacter multimanifer]GGI68359.1 lipase [Polymorphobacter multimanifer]